MLIMSECWRYSNIRKQNPQTKTILSSWAAGKVSALPGIWEILGRRSRVGGSSDTRKIHNLSSSHAHQSTAHRWICTVDDICTPAFNYGSLGSLCRALICFEINYTYNLISDRSCDDSWLSITSSHSSIFHQHVCIGETPTHICIQSLLHKIKLSRNLLYHYKSKNKEFVKNIYGPYSHVSLWCFFIL